MLELFDIAKYASKIEDEKTYRRASQMMYEKLFKEVDGQKSKEGKEGLKFTETQIDLMKQILNMVCKPECTFFMRDTSLSAFWFSYTQYIPLSEDAWNFIWFFMTNIVDADKEDWFMSYWGFAEQYYRSSLAKNKKEEVKQQRKRLKQFHIALGAYLLFKGKLNLLKKILHFTQTFPPSYTLIDNTFAEVFEEMNQIDELLDYPGVLTKRYMMSGLLNDVNSDSYVAGKLNKYFALLMVRLNDLDYNVSYCDPLSSPPDAQDMQGLKTQIRFADVLLHCLNDEVLLEQLSKIGFLRDKKDKTVTLLENYKKNVEKEIEYKLKNPETDSEKINYIKQSLIEEITNQPLYLPIKTNSSLESNTAVMEFCSIQCLEVPKDDIVKYIKRISANLEQVVISALLSQEREKYNRFFLHVSPQKTYTVRFKDLMIAWDRMKIDEGYTILAMGVYLGTFVEMYGEDEVKKLSYASGRGEFNGAKIMELLSPMRAFVIIPNESLPYIEHTKADNEAKQKGLTCIDEDHFLYSNVDSISPEKNVLKVLRKSRLIYKKDYTKYIMLKVEYSSDSLSFDIDRLKTVKDVFNEK